MLSLKSYFVMFKPMDCGSCKPQVIFLLFSILWSKYILLFVRPLTLLLTCMFYMYNTVVGAKYTFFPLIFRVIFFSTLMTVYLLSSSYLIVTFY